MEWNDSIPWFRVTGERISNRLRRYFSEGQLALIEMAYEGHKMWILNRCVSEERLDKAARFHYRLKPGPMNSGMWRENLLIAILENVIQHRGTFRP